MRLLARLFSLGFGAALISSLYDGGYSYYSMGSEKFVSANSSPIKYYFSLLWYGAIFIVATYFGFVAKLKDPSDKE